MKNFLKKISKEVKKVNVFKSPICLRYNSDSDYDTSAGGVLTIGLFIMFFAITLGQWIRLFNKKDIYSTYKVLK
jgi:hypothetical protein